MIYIYKLFAYEMFLSAIVIEVTVVRSAKPQRLDVLLQEERQMIPTIQITPTIIFFITDYFRP